MTDPQEPKPPKNMPPASEALSHLADKRAQNLRDNLARRKAQTRARQTHADATDEPSEGQS